MASEKAMPRRGNQQAASTIGRYMRCGKTLGIPATSPAAFATKAMTTEAARRGRRASSLAIPANRRCPAIRLPASDPGGTVCTQSGRTKFGFLLYGRCHAWSFIRRFYVWPLKLIALYAVLIRYRLFLNWFLRGDPGPQGCPARPDRRIRSCKGICHPFRNY